MLLGMKFALSRSARFSIGLDNISGIHEFKSDYETHKREFICVFLRERSFCMTNRLYCMLNRWKYFTCAWTPLFVGRIYYSKLS